MRPTLSPTTYERYLLEVEHRIIPALGHVPLTKLSPLAIQELYRKAVEEGLALATVRYTHAVLNRALNMAAKWGLIPANPCSRVEAPKPERYEARALEPEELSQLLDAARDTPVYVPVVLAACCGLRAGEILGLEWPDVDLERRELAVRRTLVKTGGGALVKEPKSRAGIRAVPLPPLAAASLREWRAEQARQRLALGEAWQAGERVCTRPDGTPMTYDALHHYFLRALKRAGIEGRVRFHDLRHSFATLLAKHDVHPKIAAALLGHSTTAMTLEVYSHATDALKREAMRRLEAVFPARREPR